MDYSQVYGKEIGLVILVGFLLGSVPCGYIVGRFFGVDVRSGGSRSIGATNVNRMAGKTAGVITLILDVLKGVAATIIPYYLNTIYTPHPDVISGVCAVIGHCYSPFMGGKGGKGVATSLGVFLTLAPGLTMLAILVFGVVVAATRYVSLASLVSVWFFVTIIATKAIGIYPKEFLWGSALIAVIITYKHSENINRLRAGVENKI
jgi:glycerol-3-phosphate acyltransferase PlsY